MTNIYTIDFPHLYKKGEILHIAGKDGRVYELMDGSCFHKKGLKAPRKFVVTRKGDVWWEKRFSRSSRLRRFLETL